MRSYRNRPQFDRSSKSHRARRFVPACAEALESRQLLATIYVDASVTSGAHNGGSWANAYQDLQQALGAAVSGDRIDVAAGTYKPTSGTDRTATFQLLDGVAIYGGYSGHGASNPDYRAPSANRTALSGAIGTVSTGDNSYHVVTTVDLDATSVLDGFYIVDGTANGTGFTDYTSTGGGMLNLFSSPSVNNCVFNGNRGDGAGMYNSGSSPMVTNCIFVGNSAATGGRGGGVANTSSSNPTLVNCTFSLNNAQSGGAMYNYYSSPTLVDCCFTGNRADADIGLGGGMCNTASSPALTNCVFVGNTAARGGGLDNVQSSSPILTNCTLSNNAATQFIDSSGGGLSSVGSSSASLTNCIVWGNSARNGSELYQSNGTIIATYCDVQWGWTGVGNISGNPLFVHDPSPGSDGVWDTSDDGTDLRLQPTSPAIDAGKNVAVPPGVVTDVAGNSRFQDVPTTPNTGLGSAPVVDMGAYEAAPPPTIAFTLPAQSSVESTGAVTVTILMSPPRSSPITLPLVLGGSAQQGSDYTLAATSITIPAGAASADISVNLINDIAYEADETVTLTLGLWPADSVGIITTHAITIQDNDAPVVDPITSRTVNEGAALAFTATAADPVTPGPSLTFSLDGTVPAGASITAGGAFSWTPTETQGPGTYTFTVRASKISNPVLYGTKSFTVTVNETNQAPMLPAIADMTVDEGTLISFPLGASDSDLPANSLTYSVVAGSQLPAITANGSFICTPTEAQGPGTYTMTQRVTDNGSPPLSATQTFHITVCEVNQPPVVATITSKSVQEGHPLTFTAAATDSDLPANTLSFSLDPGAPAGAAINPSTGVFAWTPTTQQGPGIYTLTVSATDNGSPPLSGSTSFTVSVGNVNQPPDLPPIPAQTVDEGTLLSFAIVATDPDLPPDTLTYSLGTGVPAGAAINPTTGLFTWTPTEAQGPGTYNIVVRVTDNGSPSAYTTRSFSVSVREVADPNVAPILSSLPDMSVDECIATRFYINATDPNPSDRCTYAMEGVTPVGVALDPSTGLFAWTPDESQGPGIYSFTVRATDNGAPSLSTTGTFNITVREVNLAPSIAPIADQTVQPGGTLRLTATGADADLPANTLAFSLDNPPTGAVINPSTGELVFSPTAASGSIPITIRAADNGSPPLSSTRTFYVTIAVGAATATFSATPADEGSPSTISFTNASGSGLLYSFDLDNDGTFEIADVTTPSRTVIFPDNGTYTVRGRIKVDGGPATTYTAAVTVNNVAPTAAFSAPTTATEGSSATISLTSPADPSSADIAAGLRYSFDMDNDGVFEIADVSNPLRALTFPDDGSYTVRGRIADKDGGSNTYTATVVVSNVAPTISLTGAGSTYEGSTYTLSIGQSADPGADTVSAYRVDWGDSLSDTYAAPGSKTHVYADGPASFTIAVFLTDADGTYAAGSQQITVMDVQPTLIISGLTAALAGQDYTLGLSAADPGADPISAWHIDWGDGTIDDVAGNPPSSPHPYSAVGSYTITATATDDDGTFSAVNSVAVSVSDVAGSISGMVFDDADADGQLDGDEAGVGGRVVFIDANANGTLDTGERAAISGADGSYCFSEVPIGPAYALCQILPPGWRTTLPASGQQAVQLSGDQPSAVADFGAGRSVSISGTLANDLNGNGRRDAREPVLAGRTVFLDNDGDSQLDAGETSMLTDTTGYFRFGDLPAGVYHLRAQTSTGWRISGKLPADDGLSTGGSSGYQQLLLTQKAMVSGTVFVHANGNGKREAAEAALRGMRIFVDLDKDGLFDSNEPSVVSDAKGNFSLQSLSAGRYVLRAAGKKGYSATSPRGGGYTLSLKKGQSLTKRLFGQRRIG